MDGCERQPEYCYLQEVLAWAPQLGLKTGGCPKSHVHMPPGCLLSSGRQYDGFYIEAAEFEGVRLQIARRVDSPFFAVRLLSDTDDRLADNVSWLIRSSAEQRKYARVARRAVMLGGPIGAKTGRPRNDGEDFRRKFAEEWQAIQHETGNRPTQDEVADRFHIDTRWLKRQFDSHIVSAGIAPDWSGYRPELFA